MLKMLANTESWDWPAEASDFILIVLKDRSRPLEDRILAAELSSELCDFGPGHARALLDILTDSGAQVGLRSAAALAFGPALELYDVDDLDEDLEDNPLTEELFHRITKELRKIVIDLEGPKELRRRALEAAVRAPQEWQNQVVREAFQSPDSDWQLTAVFCMRYLKGFEQEIARSLKHKDERVVVEGLRAAGVWEVRKAWPAVRDLIRAKTTRHHLRLLAVEVASDVGGDRARQLLSSLIDHDDQEVAGLAELVLADLIDQLD